MCVSIALYGLLVRFLLMFCGFVALVTLNRGSMNSSVGNLSYDRCSCPSGVCPGVEVLVQRTDVCLAAIQPAKHSSI